MFDFINYRVLIYLSIATLLLFIFGMGELIKSVSLGIVFPLYIYARRIKKRYNKNSDEVWQSLQKLGSIITIFLFNFSSNLKHHFRFRTLILFLSIISTLLILATEWIFVFPFCIIVLSFFMLIHYYYKINQSLSPSNYLMNFSKSFSEKISELGHTKTNKEVTIKEPYSDKKYNELESNAIVIYYLKKWMSKLKESPYLTIYFISSTLYTIIITILIFGIIYYGLYRIDNSFYTIHLIEKVNLFSFLYLSIKTFASLENNFFSINGVIPDILVTIEGLLKYLIAIIYAVFLVNILRQHLNNAVNLIISSIDGEINKLDVVLRQQHKSSVDEAVKKSIEKMRSSSRNKTITIN